MNLRDLQRNWHLFGQTDPYWAILTVPGKENNRWDPAEFFESGRAEIAEVMKYVLSVAPDVRRRRALDFGCGLGRLTGPLAGYFDAVTGIDIAPSMIEGARERGAKDGRCEFVLNQRGDLSIFETGSFDFVYSFITLQHMPPRYIRRYVREFARLLAPRGILLFQLPGRPLSPGRRFQRLRLAAYRLYRRLKPGTGAVMDMYGLPPRRVRRLLERSGCEVLAVMPDGSAGADWEGFRYCARKLC